jgi:hypothetical protein
VRGAQVDLVGGAVDREADGGVRRAAINVINELDFRALSHADVAPFPARRVDTKRR